MNIFDVVIKTDTTNKNSTNGVLYFLMHADSAEEIRETLGDDIDVAKFLTWYGLVDLVTGKLIDDWRENPKKLGKITEMKLLNIKNYGDSPGLNNFFYYIKDIKDYNEMCRKYDFDLDEIYDIDWMNAIC